MIVRPATLFLFTFASAAWSPCVADAEFVAWLPVRPETQPIVYGAGAAFRAESPVAASAPASTASARTAVIVRRPGSETLRADMLRASSKNVRWSAVRPERG